MRAETPAVRHRFAAAWAESAGSELFRVGSLSGAGSRGIRQRFLLRNRFALGPKQCDRFRSKSITHLRVVVLLEFGGFEVVVEVANRRIDQLALGLDTIERCILGGRFSLFSSQWREQEERTGGGGRDGWGG